MNPIVHLTPKEMAQIKEIAGARNQIKIDNDIVSHKWTDEKSELDIHTLGMAGEYAVSRLLGVPVDLNIHVCGDAGWDLTDKKGIFRVEVKTRGKPGWDFALNSDNLKDFQADIGVLVWPTRQSDTFEVVGWTTKVHLAFAGEVKDFGKGKRLVIRHSKLQPIRQLVELFDRMG